MDDWFRIDNAADVFSPALLIYPERIAENLRTMLRWAPAERIRPHVKTHKMPAVIRMKRELGIEKFKASTIAEAEMTAAAGGRDVLLAYQPVGPHQRRLIDLVEAHPETRFSTIVDDAAAAESLAAIAAARGITVDLYVDLNVGMNRTGILPRDAGALYHALAATEGVRPVGLHAYDGHIHETDPARVRAEAEAAFAPVWRLQQSLWEAGFPKPRVVGCGTVTSRSMAETHDLEVSAGTSVLWDAGQPTFTPSMPFVSAAVLLARVISRPTADSMCIDLGHKAVAAEMPPPRVRFFGLEDAEPLMHSEEHLVIRSDRAAEYPVGTVLYGIPTHVCPTVALYDQAWCVRQRQAAETWDIVARKRCITV